MYNHIGDKTEKNTLKRSDDVSQKKIILDIAFVFSINTFYKVMNEVYMQKGCVSPKPNRAKTQLSNA